MPTGTVETLYTYTRDARRVSGHGLIALAEKLPPIDEYPYWVQSWGNENAKPFRLMWSREREAWVHDRSGDWVQLRIRRRKDRRSRYYAENR